MGKLLMIQEQDDKRIERLKKRIGARTKIEVLRSALNLLERDVSKAERIVQWKKAAAHVAKNSKEVLREFQPYSLLHRHD